MGLDALKKSVRKLLLNTEVEPSVVLSNLRHKAALIAGDQALSSAADSVRACHAAEFVAVNLQEAKERLEEIVGTVTSDDILELVFSKFCIGK
jgi:tRNA modification GTPase